MTQENRENNINEIVSLYRQLFEVRYAPEKVNFEEGYWDDFKNSLENRSDKFLAEYKRELQSDLRVLKIEKVIEREKEKLVDEILEVYIKLETIKLEENEQVDIEKIKSYKENLMNINMINLIKYKFHLLFVLGNYKINEGINEVQKRTRK